MALTDAELVTTAEIIGELYEYTKFWALNLTDGQEASLRADIDTWNQFRDNHTVIDNGQVKIDPARTRAAITGRVRLMLRLGDGAARSVRIVRG